MPVSLQTGRREDCCSSGKHRGNKRTRKAGYSLAKRVRKLTVTISLWLAYGESKSAFLMPSDVFLLQRVGNWMPIGRRMRRYSKRVLSITYIRILRLVGHGSLFHSDRLLVVQFVQIST